MASFYAQYLMERTDDKIIESEKGFATYRYLNEGKTVYVIDVYVQPEYRRSHAATDFVNEIARIAKIAGCVEMLGTVVPSTKNATLSIKALLVYDMTLQSAADNLIIFRK